MDGINHLTKMGEIKSKPERIAKVLVDLLKRIASAAKKAFYFMVPVARKELKVTIIADSDMFRFNTEKILKTLLPYQFKITISQIIEDEFKAGDFSNHRVVYLAPLGFGSTELFSTGKGHIHEKMKVNPQMKSLFVLEAGDTPLIGPFWDDLKSAPHYVNANHARDYAQALKNFVS